MIKIGTRGSALALWQARHVQALLAPVLGEIELEVIKTTGDKNTTQPLSEIGALAGGKGLFVKEIEDALLSGRVAIAVHSGKDLPSTVTPGLAIAAFMEREDPRDALLSREPVTVATLAKGAKVGTSSLRRMTQILALRPDLDVLDLRGNVDTRVRKLDDGGYDAILLAMAGLKRMGLGHRATAVLEPEEMIPAVSQGALAVETRADDPVGEKIAVALDHAETRAAVEAERAFLAWLDGGAAGETPPMARTRVPICQLPVAAHAVLAGGKLTLDAMIGAPPDKGLTTRPRTGSAPEVVRGRASGAPESAREIGRGLAEELLAKGGERILAGLAPRWPAGSA